MRQNPVSSIINGGKGNASFMREFPNNFFKTISKKNMTRMNKITWHKASQNAPMKLYTIICEQ